ncbi:MAG: DUF4296 domain-containing protein [Bacteroidales bacterium]|nr:DUF4296 domain-containing protein [Bacteroidales bacterium]
MSKIRAGNWLLLCVMLVSCSNRIPEDDFTDILTDIYLSRAYFSSEGTSYAYWKDTIPYDRHIVEQHGYQWAQFDSTLTWYCANPKHYQDIHDEIIARLSELEKTITEELDPPEELWKHKTSRYLPADGARDSIPINILLKGIGKYVMKATIRVYAKDASIDPHIALYWWRTDTTNIGIADTFQVMPLYKHGLPVTYSIEKTLLPGNEFTHLKGNWIQHRKNEADTVWSQQIVIEDISVFHIPQKFE